MKSDSLKKEKISDNVTGEEKFNFSKPTIKMKAEVNIINVHTVREDEEMRIDLISNLYYGTSSYVDIILKLNGISNPFSIKAGQLLRIPEKDSAEQYRKKLKNVSVKPRTQFTDNKRLSQQDKRRKEFLEKKSKGKVNGSSENLPPNMLKSDQTPKEIRQDKIVLGSNMKTNKRNRE